MQRYFILVKRKERRKQKEEKMAEGRAMRGKDIDKYVSFTSNSEIQNSLVNWNLANKYVKIFISVLC